MFFVLSKILWFVAAPTNALLLILLIGQGLVWAGRRRAGQALTGAALMLLLVIGFLPVGTLLLLPLENRFPPAPADLPALAGIIVLGGSTDEAISAARDQPTVTDAATRITAGVELARRYPSAKLVFTGGSGALLLRDGTEAADTRRLWIAMGVPPERIVTEDRSRNTDENARFTRALLRPTPDQDWLLVTSAFHMPRSMGLFRAQGFRVTAYPVDYRTAGTWTDLFGARDATAGLARFATALREWIGLVVYDATGRIGTLFPGPEPRIPSP